MEKNFFIKITGGGYNIDDKINKIQLGRILSIVTSDDNTPTDVFSPSQQSNKNKAKRRTKANLFSPVLVRKELEALHIDPVSSLYGNYWTTKTKSDRLMWILAVLNENKFESLNQKEISFIAEKLGDNIPKKSITSLLNSHKKGGRVAPSLMGTVRTVRILKPGLDYVKKSTVSIKGDSVDLSRYGSRSK